MRARFDPILFDLDGTLVDSGADIAAAVNRTLVRLSIAPLPDTEIVSFVGDGVRRLVERTLARVGRDDVDEAVRLVKADYGAHCLDRTLPFPGIPRLLEDLAGARLAVVTSKTSSFARAVLEGLGLARFFHALVGGDETERIKPDPAPVELALARLGSTAAGGIMVGDGHQDVRAGRAAGLATCGVLWGFDRGASLDDARPDHRVATVDALRALLVGG